ncbi:MAG: GNAT family N-acetyltransferase [Ginsengibacter sp.]
MNEIIIIRKARLHDLEQLYSFEQGVIQAERPFDQTLKNGLIHYYDLEQMINASHIELVVAEMNEQIIGSGYGRIDKSKIFQKDPSYVYLGFMYVVPEHRGKGINKMIIENLKNWAHQQGINELRLEVYNNNLAAIKAYEKIGFTRHIIEMRFNLDE